MDRKREFRRLYRLLNLSAADVGKLIDGTPGSVRQYVSAGKSARVPTEAVIDAMRVAWKERATERLEKTVSDLRDIGFIIDWSRIEHALHEGPVTFTKPPFAQGHYEEGQNMSFNSNPDRLADGAVFVMVNRNEGAVRAQAATLDAAADELTQFGGNGWLEQVVCTSEETATFAAYRVPAGDYTADDAAKVTSEGEFLGGFNWTVWDDPEA